MFILKKAVPPFLLPPGIFISVLLLAGVGCLFNRRLKSGLLCLIFGAAMWLFSIAPVSDALLRPLESVYPVPKNPTGDVIVLLCGGARRGVPDLSGEGAPSDVTVARMITAARLQRQLEIPIIVSGGTVFGKGPSEAAIVRRFMLDIGVPPERVIVEGSSRDTFENARNTAAICTARGYTRPILVTSALHLRRAVWCFKMVGQKVVPFPADIRSLHSTPYVWTNYLPGGYRNLSAALHEYMGLAYYRLVYDDAG